MDVFLGLAILAIVIVGGIWYAKRNSAQGGGGSGGSGGDTKNQHK